MTLSGKNGLKKVVTYDEEKERRKKQEEKQTTSGAVTQEEKTALGKKVISYWGEPGAKLGGTGADYAKAAQEAGYLSEKESRTLDAINARRQSQKTQTASAPKVSDLTERQKRAKQAAELFLELTQKKPNGYMIANANANYAREQLDRTEQEYEDFLTANQDSYTPPVNLPEAVNLQIKAQELDSAVEYWENQKITRKNMEEISRWSEEDRAALDAYINAKNARDMNTSNPLIYYAKTKEAADAWSVLAEKYDEEKLKRLVESYEWHLSGQAAEQVKDWGEQHATGFLGKVAASAATVGTGLIGSVTSPVGYLTEMMQRTGQYKTLNPNNIGNLPNVYSGAVRGKVAGDLEQKGVLGKVGSFAYQGGMSALDSALRLGLTGSSGGALALAGMGSFGQTVSQASAQGATPGQAVMLGIISGSLEAGTEKLSLDKLLGGIGSGKMNPGQILKLAAGQAGVEVAEEELSWMGNALAEAAILREKSSTNQRIGEMVANGMSYEEAVAQVNRELLLEAAETAAVSAFSGGMMSGTASLANNMRISGQKDSGQGAVESVAGQTAEPAAVEAAPEMGAEVLQEAQGAEQSDETEEDMKRVTAIEAIREVIGGKTQQEGTIQKEQQAAGDIQEKKHISLEDYANRESPLWRNVEYADDETKAAITQEAHNRMVGSGAVVKVSDDVAQNVAKSFPDLRGMKKKERAPILKDAISSLKKDLRQFLGKFSGQSFEFEVNGQILEAKLYSTGINEVLEKVTKDKAGMLYTSGEIFRNARYLYSTSDYDGDPNVYRWNYFYTPVQIGENIVGVRIAVRDVVQGQNHLPESQIYNWGIKKDAPLGGAQPVVSDSSRDASSGVSNNTISESGENVNRQGANPESSVGAAERGFTGKQSYYDLLTDENAQPDRPGDVRPMEVPKTDAYGRRVSEFTANAYGAEVTPDAMASRIEELVADGALGFDTRTNEQSLKNASEEISRRGMASTRNQITKSIADGKIRDGDIEKAMLLYAAYANRKSQSAQDNAAEMMVDLAAMANMTGRNLQLFKLLRRMTPEGQLMTVQKTVERYVDQLNEKRSGKQQAEVSIPQELMEQYLDAAQADIQDQTAQTAKAKEDAEQAIYKVAAAQIKATPMEKLNAWRYMAMLGNVKTQVRNIAGNTAFRPYAATKRAIGAVLEQMFIEQDNRTKSILGFGKDARALRAWAAKDAKSADAEKLFSYSAQTGDTARGQIEENRVIFDTKALEEVRKFIRAVPEGADMIFKRTEYAASLASFLKARGYTAADLETGNVGEDVLNEARGYAAQEALKATFNDRNAVSDFLSKRYKGDNAFGKAMNLMAEGVLPFRRTPANILVRAMEYSPANIGRSMYNFATKVRGGEMTASTAIDQMAAGLTGTGAMVLGYALASGLFGFKLQGHLDDEDEKNAGHQAYALEIGGKSYTVDWAAPANIPLFVGANIYEAMKDRDADTGWFVAAVDASVNSLEPMLELSCLSSLSDLLESVRYAEDGTEVYTVAAQAATSYLNQFIPTLFGQIEQAAEGEKNQVYSGADTAIERSIEKTIGRATQKIPGLDLYQAQKYDNWGRAAETANPFDALVNPSYSSEISTDPVDQEIQRLNQAQDQNVSIGKPAQTVTYTDKNGTLHQNRRLTVQQWETVQKVYGQTAKQVLDGLVGSGDYEALTDGQKAKVFNLVYDYAREQSRKEAIQDYTGGGESWMEGIEGREGAAIIRKVAASEFTGAFEALTGEWKNGGDGAKAAAQIEEAYKVYQGLSAKAKSAVWEDSSGRLKCFLSAKNEKMDTDTFVELYRSYYEINTGDRKAAQKAEDWAYVLQKAKEAGTITERQLQAMKNGLTISSGFTVEAEKFDQLTGAGISADKADYVTDLIAGIEPQKGYSAVRDIQKAEKVAGAASLTESEKVAAMKLYLSDSQEQNLGEMLDLGYAAKDYVRAWQIYDGESGTGKKKRTIARYQEEFGISYAAAKAMYEIYG